MACYVSKARSMTTGYRGHGCLLILNLQPSSKVTVIIDISRMVIVLIMGILAIVVIRIIVLIMRILIIFKIIRKSIVA